MAFADDLKKGIDRAIRIVKMDRAAISETADDPAAFQVGLAIVAIGGLASGIGGILRSVSGLVVGPIMSVVGSFIGVGILYLVGLVLRPPSWDFMRLYRAASHVMILGWIGVVSIVPILGALVMLLVGIYELVVLVVTVETVGACDRTKAILIVILPAVICCTLIVAAAFLGGAALLSAIGAGALAGSN